MEVPTCKPWHERRARAHLASTYCDAGPVLSPTVARWARQPVSTQRGRGSAEQGARQHLTFFGQKGFAGTVRYPEPVPEAFLLNIMTDAPVYARS